MLSDFFHSTIAALIDLFCVPEAVPKTAAIDPELARKLSIERVLERNADR